MEHGLESRYMLKNIASLAICSNPPLGRDKSLGAPKFATLAYWGFPAASRGPLKFSA